MSGSASSPQDPWPTRVLARAGLDLTIFYEPRPRARGDLLGEPAHLAAAIVAMSCEAISTASASVGFIILLVAGALRAAALARPWRRMLQERWIQLLLLWMAWMALSIVWSPDPAKGLDRLGTMKFFLWLPLLWPLHRQWRWLLAGFLFAAFVLQGVQVAGAVLGVTSHGMSVIFGLRHATLTGTWDAIALSCWLFMAVTVTWRAMLLCAPFTLLSALGFVWAGQRASLVGVLLEILVANAALAITVRGWMRRAAVRFGLSLVVIGCVYLVAGAALTDKVKQLVRETESSMQSHTPQVMEVRLAMWKMSLIAWRRSPVAGVGYGGYHEATKDVTEVSYPEFDIKLFDTPHSTYVMILTENGVIGLALFAAWAGACLGRGLQQVRGDPARIGAFGGTVMWFGAAMFDSFHTRGVFLSVGVIVMALATMPLSDGSGSGRAAA